MAELFSLRRSLRIEWKVKDIFAMNSRQIRAFSFGGSRCKLLLKAYGTAETERIVIYLSRKNSNKTPLYEIRVDVFIEDRNRKLHFPMGRSSSDADVMVWYEYASELRKKAEVFTTTGVVTFVAVLLLEVSEDEFGREESAQTDWTLETLANLECLSLDFTHLLDDKALSDVTLKCGNRTISVHKLVLCARSEAFRAMFRNATSDFRKATIEISDMEPSTFKQFIEYIYSGRLPNLSMKSAQQLYEAAERYAVHSLQTFCGPGSEDIKDCTLSFIRNTDLLHDEKN